MRISPLTSIAVGLGAAGVGKLAGLQLVRDNFKRWGYPDASRVVVGGIEVGVAATAVAALRDPGARPVAAVGTLLSMAGAAATHAQAGESLPNYVPVAGLTVAALAVLVGK
jgi:DoxX-like family